MKWITENWSFIVALLCMICVIVENVVNFYCEPKSKKISAVKEFLLYAVTIAEKELGSGTGVLKLRYVWKMCCETFAWLPKIVTFDTFSGWVDDALEWMKVQLESNKNVKEYIDEDK